MTLKTSSAISQVDPEWAWAPFEPSVDTPWDRRAAAHLFRRAGFAAPDDQVTNAVAQSPAEVVQQLIDSDQSAAFLNESTALADSCLATGNAQQLSGWWAWRMLHTPVPLLEKTTLFWHGHFATSAAKVEDANLMLEQNDLLRKFAFGDFSQFVLEISRNPAMLIFLDSVSNRKAHPNENYAREIMELFCLGEGHYTEDDIRELARCFTGWEVKREKFRFNRYQHDTGSKTIFGATGTFGGEDGVRIVLEQDAAAEFITGRLIRFFAFDEPHASPELIAPLATLFRESGMQAKPVIRRILSSNLLFSDHARGRKVRSPVEFGIGLLRAFEGSTNVFQLADSVNTLGQGLFYPPSVKGWDGGRTWINSSTLLGRSNLVRRLLESDTTRFGQTTPLEYFRSIGASSKHDIVNKCEELLFAVPVPDQAKMRVVALLESDGGGKRGLTEGLHALFTLPEFQLN
jgi:uncharacterized protein (DUF1800 family)